MKNRFVEDVYDTMCGQLLEAYCVSGVENAFQSGSRCEKLYGEMLEAYGRLCDRLGVLNEDVDVEIIINALLEIQKELCCKMYECGAQFGSIE